jgi:hypothetical protein
MGMSRRKVLRDYPQIAGHEEAIIAALAEWFRPGMARPTRENLGNFHMKTAKLALRRVLLDRNITDEVKEPARAALRVLKAIFHPNGRVGGREASYHDHQSGHHHR